MNRIQALLILLVFIAIVTFGMLGSGYILTLDHVIADRDILLLPASFEYWNMLPFRFLFYALNLVLPGVLLSNILVLCTISLIFSSSYYFFRHEHDGGYASLFVSLFYAINPFVYTRFLAGQWVLLAAYGFFPCLLHLCSRSFESQNIHKKTVPILLGLSIALIGSLSIHAFVMAVSITLFYFVGVARLRSMEHWKAFFLVILSVVVATSYWTVPAVLESKVSILTTFDWRHLNAFRTADSPVIGTLGNVMALYGFWGEREPWAGQFIWTKDYPIFWLISGCILGYFIFSGVFYYLKDRSTRRKGIAFLVLGIMSVIFSCGVGDSIFKSINSWLFLNSGFWQGFRDSQKWSGVLVLVYVFFAGHGVRGRCTRMRSVFASLAVLIYTFPMLFGFWGQLKPVQYPEAWYRANAILQKDPDCKALFLPWHLYFTLKFNHGLLTASPARDFFECELVTSRQVELGEIGQQGPVDPAYDAIEGVVTGKDGWNSEQSLEILRTAGIKYVIFAKDIQDSDQWKYEFLNQPSLKSYTWDGLTIYQLTN